MTIRDRIASLFRRDETPALPSPRTDALVGMSAGYDQPGIGLGCSAERVRQAGFVGGRSLSQYEVDALLRYSAIARRICHVQAEDATRGGVEVRGAEQATQEAVAGELDRVGWWQHVVTGRGWARAYGGAVTILEIDDGRSWSEPVDYAGIQSVGKMLTIDREDVVMLEWPRLLESQIPIAVEPTRIHVQIRQGPYTRTVSVHRSRCIVWHGHRASQREASSDDWWWGTSTLDLVDSSLTRYGAAHQLAAEMLAVATQEVLSSPSVRDAIVQQGGAQALRNRASSLRYGLGVLGMLVIDDAESYEIKSRGAPGVAEILEALRGELVAATGIPRIKLYGEQPGGLGEQGMPGELRVWYDQVEVDRPYLIGEPTRYAIRLIASAADTPCALPPGPIVLEWPSLVTPSDEERLASRKSAAEARKIDIDAGIITEDEARHDPDVADHYPEIDIKEPAPGKPEPSPIFGGDAQADADPDAPWQPEPGEALIGLAEAGAHLGVGPASVRRLVREGSIRGGYVGSRWRVSLRDVRQLQAGILARRETQQGTPGAAEGQGGT